MKSNRFTYNGGKEFNSSILEWKLKLKKIIKIKEKERWKGGGERDFLQEISYLTCSETSDEKNNYIFYICAYMK